MSNKFSSSESTRESELAIDGLPHKKQFLEYIFEAKWWKDYELEEGQRHRIHTGFLESLLMDFMKRMMSYKKYGHLTVEQKERIDQSLKLLFLEESNMSVAEEEVLKKYCNSKTKLLEFGSGISTLHHAMMCKSVVSIESDPYWYGRVALLLYILDLELVAQPLLVPGINYPYSFAEAFPDEKFDVVSIDGLRRLECAKSILPYIHDDSVVVFSDFWREKRHKENNFSKVFEWYDVIESCKEGNTYVVLKRKKDYPWD